MGSEMCIRDSFNPIDNSNLGKVENLRIFPANIFVTSENQLENAIKNIQFDLKDQIDFFKDMGRNLEAKRIEERISPEKEERPKSSKKRAQPGPFLVPNSPARRSKRLILEDGTRVEVPFTRVRNYPYAMGRRTQSKLPSSIRDPF